jgi:predicted nucleic acid-binding protein
VDTSVWSLALRRDGRGAIREATLLADLIGRGETVCLTGAILQEVLQGFHDAARTLRLARELEPFPLLELSREDHVFAARVRNTCRSHGVQVGTIDAQIATASLRHQAPLLTTDQDFGRIARHFPLKLL